MMPELNSGTAIIVHPELNKKASSSFFEPELEDRLEEVCGLARAIHLTVVEVKTFRIKKPAPGYLIGKGNREEIGRLIEGIKPDIIIVNHTLTPVQQRNLEKEWHAKVIDRTGLILEIFGERAQTKEGKIQVELAMLEYQRSRLVKSWTHLERQRGSTSFIGGPGETQIEIDRRLIGERIVKLKKNLEHVLKNRDLQRRSREQVPFPIIALVGYTNAGKSTLFNTLTGAEVFAEDLLFATLDPTMRKLTLSNRQDVILADTVGFIADLPTHLIAAFRATLEQLQYADIILHVRDISWPDHKAQKLEVIKILEGLGIHYEQDSRIIEVWNKTDALPLDEQQEITSKARFNENTVPVSALTGEGTDLLVKMIEDHLAKDKIRTSFDIPIADGKALAWLHEHANILAKATQKKHITVDIEIDPANLGRFVGNFNYKKATGDKDR